MSVSGRNAPLSPVSVGGSEWPGSKHPPDGGSLPTGRGNLASPPLSSSSNSNVMSMNGFSSGPRSNGGGPSPPASVGRSSMGTGAYARSESGRNSTRTEMMDDSVLQEHYHALKLFLHGRGADAQQPPNKARDKLLRLSSVQFYELSTDVFDELMRRQANARAPPNSPNGPPAFLLPEKTFHPKRNQARQRLSSLGPPRFRDLATDVFYELERRFPHFVGGEIPRGGSSMSMRGPPGRTGTPSNGYGPRRMRQASDAGSMRGPPPPDAYGIPPSPGLPNGEFGRPMQKQLNQNNTIVPNKSTMVEEDDDADPYGIGSNRESKRSAGSSEVCTPLAEFPDSRLTDTQTDKKLIEDYQSQVRDLREKLDSMEDAMKKKEDELSNALEGGQEKKEWEDVRLDLENKLTEAQNLNASMKQELEKVRDDHDQETRQLRDQLVEMEQSSGFANADAKLQEENKKLQDLLLEQRQVTDEVRREAQEFLLEMRTLSQQSTTNYEKQLELEKTVEQLEGEVKQWKGLYARTKTQLRSMRASSTGLTIDQGAGNMVRDKGFTEENGLVKDVHVTRFQISVDELLQQARKESPEKVIDAMKSVVVSVRRITRDVDEATPNDEPFAEQKPKLKAKVSSTANHLITSSKNFAAGGGLSPVSLLDAAASHLAAAVVELLRSAKIRPTPAEQLDEDDDGSVTPVESTGFFSPRSTTDVSNTQESLPPPPPFNGLGGMRASAGSSAYSPVSSPRESVEPNSRRGTNGIGYMGMGKGAPNGHMYHDSHGEDLKVDDYYSY